MAKWFGFNPPFVGGNQNVLSRQEDNKLIKNDLLQLLLTAPAERVMRPSYGSPIPPYLFENMDTDSLSELRSDILSAIERNENRVNVNSLKLNVYRDEHILKIFLIVSMITDPESIITIEANLPLPE